METAPHGLKKRLAALVLSLLLLVTCLPGALAVDLNVDAGFYFKQSRGGTCTLASAAMMLRPVSYTHLRAHETDSYLVCRLLLEKKT